MFLIGKNITLIITHLILEECKGFIAFVTIVKDTGLCIESWHIILGRMCKRMMFYL